MILEVLLVLLILGAGSSYAAFVAKRAPVYTGLANLAIWLLVAYGATSIDLVSDSGALQEGVASEPALAVLGFGNALLSVLVILAAAAGEYIDDPRDSAASQPDPRNFK
jgi:Fe2+ transport system protein B